MTEPEDLERAIVGAVAELTGEEVADAGRPHHEQAQRLWRALGFPEADGAIAFSTADADALTRVAAIVQDGELDFDTIVRMTRAVGQTMDRLAEWEVATLVAQLDKARHGDVQARRGAAPGAHDRAQLRGAADLCLAPPPGGGRRPRREPRRRRRRAGGRGDGRVRRPRQLQRPHQPARRARDRRPGGGLRGAQPRRRLAAPRPGGQDPRRLGAVHRPLAGRGRGDRLGHRPGDRWRPAASRRTRRTGDRDRSCCGWATSTARR